MTRRRPRGLSSEDRALWQKVKDSAVPLRPDAPHPLAELPKSLAETAPPPQERAPLPSFSVGELAGETALGHSRQPPLPEPVRMDRKAFGKLKRGKLAPEARIDLHGMTLAQANPALIRFILASQSAGRRLVLVITGKGKERDLGDPIPAQRGLLRTQVPQWLAMPPLSPAVLQISQAHQRHGGAGAFYVYLKRSR